MLRQLGNRIVLVVLLLSLSVPFTVSGQDDITITVAVPESEVELMDGAAGRFTEQTGIGVELISVPDNPDDRVAQYLLDQEGGTMPDAITAPSTAMYLLGMHMVDLSEYGVPDLFESVVDSGRINHDNMLLGLPWRIDLSMMYYRPDIMEQLGYGGFETWEDVFQIAAESQEFQRSEGMDEFWGLLWQGSNDMSLAYNAAEWMYSVNGQPYILAGEEEVETVVNTEESVGIVEAFTGSIDFISPPDVISQGPFDTYEIFSSGNAMFMRNWNFAYNLLLDSGVPFGVAPLPAGGSGTRTSTIDGEYLMVNDMSENVDAAVAFVLFLQSEQEQIIRLEEAGYIPASPSIYEEYGGDYPFLNDFLPIIEVGQAMPKTEGLDPHLDLAQTIYDIETGGVDAQEGLDTLAFGWNPCLIWPWRC